MINFNKGDSTYLQEDRNRQKHDDSMLAHKWFFWTQHGQHRLHTIGEIRLKYK